MTFPAVSVCAVSDVSCCLSVSDVSCLLSQCVLCLTCPAVSVCAVSVCAVSDVSQSVLRLRAVLQLEGQIRRLLPLVPGFVPPAAIFDADTPPAPPAAAAAAAAAAKRQKPPTKRWVSAAPSLAIVV